MEQAERKKGITREYPQKYLRFFAALIACILLAAALGIVSASTLQVEVLDKGKSTLHYVATQDKDEILSLIGFGSDDEIDAELSEFVDGKATLTIYRPFTATIIDGGKEVTCRVLHATVAETLETAGITLSEDDLMDADPDDLASEEPITITRVTYETDTETEEIPFESTTKETSTMLLGTSRVVSAGKAGEKTLTYRVRYENGKEVERVLEKEEVTAEPVDQVTYVGTTPLVARTGAISTLGSVPLDKNGIPVSYKKVVSGYSAVAYYAEAGAGTASGIMRCQPGVVAVNPAVIPYGTRMYIVANDGTVYGYAIAADTGSSVRNGVVDLDLFMSTYNDCVRWGRKTVTIYFL